MRAGNLRHLVTIQKNTPTADGMGGQTASWAATSTAWAGIWPVSAKERVSNQQLETQLTHKIRIRYQAGVTTAKRVKYDTRYFKIISIINMDERNITLDLLCTEIESV